MMKSLIFIETVCLTLLKQDVYLSPRNLHMVPQKEGESVKTIINKNSKTSDLTIIGFCNELVKKQKLDIFEGYNKLGNVLFVNSIKEKISNSAIFAKKFLTVGTKITPYKNKKKTKKRK